MKISPLDSFSEKLRQLQSRQTDVLAEVNKRKAECAVLRDRLQKGHASSDPQQQRVEQILGNVTTRTLPDRERFKQLLGEIDDYTAAFGRLDGEIRKEMHAASVKLCKSVEQEHSRLARNFASAVIEMHKSHGDYFEFLDAVEAAGASVGPLKPVFPSYIDSPKDRSSFYHWTLKDFRENGHIKMSDIPEAVR